MMLNKSLSLLLACIASLQLAENFTHAQPKTRGASKPNIVFILTDAGRWDCLSAAGNARIKTPSLDRICASGRRFENAFVTVAICSPSRAACLTGRYAQRIHRQSEGPRRASPEQAFRKTGSRWRWKVAAGRNQIMSDERRSATAYDEFLRVTNTSAILAARAIAVTQRSY